MPPKLAVCIYFEFQEQHISDQLVVVALDKPSTIEDAHYLFRPDSPLADLRGIDYPYIPSSRLCQMDLMHICCAQDRPDISNQWANRAQRHIYVHQHI